MQRYVVLQFYLIVIGALTLQASVYVGEKVRSMKGCSCCTLTSPSGLEGSTASTVTSSFLSSGRPGLLMGVEVWGCSRGVMGMPASIRAAWEKTGALTGRAPRWVLTTGGQRDGGGEG